MVYSNESRWAENKNTTNTVIGREGGREGEVNIAPLADNPVVMVYGVTPKDV